MRLPSSLLPLLLAGLSALPSGAAASGPNVLLVTVDTLRPDRLGAWGYERPTSPCVDALAAGGTVFPTMIVPRGQTWPTLATILTSQAPVVHGIRRNGQSFAGTPTTLAHVLGDDGAVCFASLSNSGEAGWPGFDAVLDRRDHDGEVHRAAVEFLAEHRDERFFLWVHYFSPHRPFRPPARLAARFDPGYDGPVDGSIEQMNRITASGTDLPPRDLEHMLALYDGEVLRADRFVGRLMRAVDDLGLAETTLVVFTADHGEELYERNRYFSHSASIYDTVLRAPLVFRWPGRIRAGRLDPGIVEAMDVAPTILGLAGLPVPASFAGRDLSEALLRGEPVDAGHVAFSELEDKIVSVRTPDWRYLHNPTDFDFPLVTDGNPEVAIPFEREELYDHRTDPGERHDVSASRSDVAGRLRDRVLAWQRAHSWEERNREHAAREVPEEIRESLRAIGYVD